VTVTTTRFVPAFTQVTIPVGGNAHAAIQDAIDALGNDGGTVVLGPGDWQLIASVQVPKRVTLQGVGSDATRLFPSHTLSAIEIKGDRGTVKDLGIIRAEEIGVGIDVGDTTHHWTISNVRIDNSSTGIRAEGYNTNFLIDRCQVRGCATGIRTAFGCRHGFIKHSRIHSNTIGWEIEGRTDQAPASGSNDLHADSCNIASNGTGIKAINIVHQCSVYSSRFENDTIGLDIGAGVTSFRYRNLYRTGNGTFLVDNGTDTQEDWL